MIQACASQRYVRLVGGNLVSSAITNTDAIRIETLSRVSKPRMHWHFAFVVGGGLQADDGDPARIW